MPEPVIFKFNYIYFPVSLMMIERMGRRILLIVSCTIVAASMATLALYLMHFDRIDQNYKWVSLLIIIVAFIGYSFGLATIPLSLIGELLPAK